MATQDDHVAYPTLLRVAILAGCAFTRFDSNSSVFASMNMSMPSSETLFPVWTIDANSRHHW